MRQEFGTDDAAEGEKISKDHQKPAHTYCDHTMANGPAEGIAISFGHVGHDWVAPFVCPLRERKTGEYGCDQDREQQRPQQREGYGPSHGVEKPAFDTLQRKDRQESSDGDNDGIEHRALYFMRGKTNSFGRGLDPIGMA